MNVKNRRILSLFLLFLATAILGLTGCDTVDSKLDVPDGRDSDNNRYEDSDIIGPVLKLKIKDAPEQQKSQQDMLQQQTSSDPDYE